MAVGLAAAGLAGGLSLLGGALRNRAASALSQRQMDFQERMSSTAHQREVADLRAAGLNPILSATGGSGASSPGGSMPTVENIAAPAVSSALSARRLAQDLKNLQAVELNTKAQTDKVKVDTILSGLQTQVLGPPAALGGWLTSLAEGLSSRGPVAANLIRGGAKIRMDQFEDFLSSSAQGAKELRSRVQKWISDNLRVPRSVVGRKSAVQVYFGNERR